MNILLYVKLEFKEHTTSSKTGLTPVIKRAMRTECESPGTHMISMIVGSRERVLEELAIDERGKSEGILLVVSRVLGGGARLSGIGIKDIFPETDSVTRVCRERSDELSPIDRTSESRATHATGFSPGDESLTTSQT